jgi:hypothetical protein
VTFADRAGLGLVALSALIYGYAYLTDDARQINLAKDKTYLGEVADCAKILPIPKGQKATADEQFRNEFLGLGCPPSKPETVEPFPLSEAFKGVVLLSLYFALPVWIVLRIFGFVFGGSTHRRDPI